MCSDLGNNNRKYYAILISSSILSTNIIVLGMSNIPQVCGTNISNSLKPFCLISLTIYVIFGQSKVRLYRCTSICKCRHLRMYSRTLHIIVIDSAIIGISGKKARSFPIFAYFFQNSCYPHSKFASSITIHARRRQNALN